jgi:hypothetical protein
MDPFTITTGCVALVATIAKVSSQISEFVREVRDARNDLDAVSRELVSLNNVLGILSEDAQSPAVETFPPNLRNQVSSVLKSCQIALGQIETCLQTYSRGGLTEGARWSVHGRSDIDKLRSTLEAQKSALDLALDLVELYEHPRRGRVLPLM